ncbi:hypothetical protein GQ53DRAFT_693053 [Thozetella sp. PMI_491]|nr:hypothetical protein GQ53DRAFT_693053 [Thozetella sp. PMI_491]
MTLPPSHQVLPIIRSFVDTFNTVMPLFHPKTLLKMVNDWYNIPHQRDAVSWAAINVVLALAYKQNLTGSSGLGGGETLASDHLRKAQSVISDVILGNTELLNVQVVVAMTMLLQASKDLKPSLILIATAMRLAHELGLHTRAAESQLEPDVSRQHSHVFWIAYILDKDLSMRAHKPSIQRDDDIDIDVPMPATSHDRSLHHDGQSDDDLTNDNLGVVKTLSGDARVNYFLARIRLASIQGGIYDYLYSARSKTRSASERAVALDSLVRALEEWKLSIPPEFDAALAPQTLSPASLSFFCVLHAASFSCKAMINRAHAWNETWVQSLRDSCANSTQLRLPSQWESLVHDARDFVILFETVPPRGYGLIWESSCSYLTAVTLLAANNVSRPFDDKVLADIRLINNAVRFIDDLTTKGNIDGNEQLQMVRNVCVELNDIALRKRDETLIMGLNNFPMFEHT